MNYTTPDYTNNYENPFGPNDTSINDDSSSSDNSDSSSDTTVDIISNADPQLHFTFEEYCSILRSKSGKPGKKNISIVYRNKKNYSTMFISFDVYIAKYGNYINLALNKMKLPKGNGMSYTVDKDVMTINGKETKYGNKKIAFFKIQCFVASTNAGTNTSTTYVIPLSIYYEYRSLERNTSPNASALEIEPKIVLKGEPIMIIFDIISRQNTNNLYGSVEKLINYGNNVRIPTLLHINYTEKKEGLLKWTKSFEIDNVLENETVSVINKSNDVYKLLDAVDESFAFGVSIFKDSRIKNIICSTNNICLQKN